MKNLAEKKRIWTLLSESYVDNEMDESDFYRIAVEFLKSPFTFHEIKSIDKYEVFPLLHLNLLSIAGNWTGIDEEWLVQQIIRNSHNRTIWTQVRIEITYAIFKRLNSSFWRKLEATISKIS